MIWAILAIYILGAFVASYVVGKNNKEYRQDDSRYLEPVGHISLWFLFAIIHLVILVVTFIAYPFNWVYKIGLGK